MDNEHVPKRGRRPGRAARGLKKTTISLPADAVALLRTLSDERNATFAEVIRRALVLDHYLTDLTRSGAKLLVEEMDGGRVKELVII